MTEDIMNMKMEVDSSDVIRAEHLVGNLASSMKRASATSSVYGRYLSKEFGTTSNQLEKISKSVKKFAENQVAEERRKAQQLMQISSSVQRIRDKELANELRASKLTLQTQRDLASFKQKMADNARKAEIAEANSRTSWLREAARMERLYIADLKTEKQLSEEQNLLLGKREVVLYNLCPMSEE